MMLGSTTLGLGVCLSSSESGGLSSVMEVSSIVEENW